MKTCAAITFIILSLVSSVTIVNSLLSSRARKEIDEIVEATLKCRHIPGLSISIVSKTNGTLMEKGYGLADISANIRVTENTLFPVGSTTKAFTTTLLALIMDKHQGTKTAFNWKTPIHHLLQKEWAGLYDNLLTNYLTLEDILSHKTGIPDYFLLLLASYPETLTRKEFVQTLRYHKPESAFRTDFSYNNHMYALAGYVAEIMERQCWENLTRSYLLKPLEMSSTIFVPEALQPGVKNKMAVSYFYDNGTYAPVDLKFLHQVDVAGPAGSIVSSSHDMAKWMRMHLKNGETSSGQPLLRDVQWLLDTYTEKNVASVRQLNEKDLVRPKHPVSDVHVAYDMGWMTNYYRGYKRVWHSGSISTFKSQVWMYPDAEFGIFVATNGLSPSVSLGLNQILHLVSDLMLGEPTWFNASSVREDCGKSSPDDASSQQNRDSNGADLPDDKLPRSPLDYVGVYENTVFGAVTISYNATSRRLDLSMGRFLSASLHYKQEGDTFYTALTGVAWFIHDRIPVKFTASGGKLGSLEIPLAKSTLDSSSTARFVRAGAGLSSATGTLNLPATNFTDGSDCSVGPAIVVSSMTLMASIVWTVGLMLTRT